MQKFETILYDRTERIIRITLNRPDKRNSLTTQMLEELAAAFDEAEKEKDACCKCVGFRNRSDGT